MPAISFVRTPWPCVPGHAALQSSWWIPPSTGTATMLPWCSTRTRHVARTARAVWIGQRLPSRGTRVLIDVSRAYNHLVHDERLAGWTPEQIATARRWVEVWKQAGPRLERVRREELRHLDPQRAVALLCGEADYTVPPRAPRPTSGLIEQQRWFMKAASRRE